MTNDEKLTEQELIEALEKAPLPHPTEDGELCNLPRKTEDWPNGFSRSAQL